MKSILLMKTNIGVAIAVLQTNHEVADDGYAGAVTLELLVGELSVILLRLKELVVEVKVVFLALYELARRYQYVKQQVVELVGRVEVILLARLGSVRRVLLFQFVHDTEYGVRTA